MDRSPPKSVTSYFYTTIFKPTPGDAILPVSRMPAEAERFKMQQKLALTFKGTAQPEFTNLNVILKQHVAIGQLDPLKLSYRTPLYSSSA